MRKAKEDYERFVGMIRAANEVLGRRTEPFRDEEGTIVGGFVASTAIASSLEAYIREKEGNLGAFFAYMDEKLGNFPKA